MHHIEGALAQGIPVGVYHNFIAFRDGRAQAQFLLDTIAPYRDRMTYLPAVDVEKHYNQSPEHIADALYDTARTLEAAFGAKPAIYTRRKFWNDYVGTQHDAYFAQCPLWLAAYGVDEPLLPRCWSTYALHQYTDAGSIEGIEGNVDMSRIPNPPPATSQPLQLVYPVDTPAQIAQAFGVNTTGDPTFYTKHGFPGHEGVDFRGRQGDGVYSVLPGTIKLIARDDGVHPYGNHIRITHRIGSDVYETIYAHLRGFVPGLVNGDDVNAGQKIGFMGNTGNVVKRGGDGTHLHFTLKKAGATARGETTYAKDVIDPTPYFLK